MCTTVGRPSTATQIVRRDRQERGNYRNQGQNGQPGQGQGQGQGQDGNAGGWRGDRGGGKKSEQATDDIAFERFKKRFRR
jgi:hypothetical protein